MKANLKVFLPGTLQIMKKLLPKKVVGNLKSTDSKTIREYIDEENMPVKWGGKDDYVYNFEPEAHSDEMNAKLEVTNNNTEEQTNLNSLHRKVSSN
jgi:hypothetical protein